MASVVLGAQWGDEGKGKLVDVLCQDIDVCARCQGGSNAGHTIVAEGVKYALHLVPSGIINRNTVNVIGNGVVIHLPSLMNELADLKAKGVDCTSRLVLSDRAHLLFDFHQTIDGLKEQELSGDNKQIGTTKRGIGPAYSSKMSRSGIRVGDLLTFEQSFPVRFRRMVENKFRRFGKFDCDIDAEIARYRQYAQQLREMITDSVVYVNRAILDGKRVLIEGANASMLDIDFGTYPYVTSSNASIGGACTGLGIPPQRIADVYGVVKAYLTRVGAGPFPSELDDAVGEHMQNVGHEYGTTTGRKRRCGWLDMVALQYSALINGFTAVCLTKLDVLSGLSELKLAVALTAPDGKVYCNGEFPSNLNILETVSVTYETFPGWNEDISQVRTFDALPSNAKAYVLRVEQLIGVPIRWIGVGPARDDVVIKPPMTES